MAIGIGVKIGTANSVAVAASKQSWEGAVSVETSALVDADDFLGRVGDPVPMLDEHGRTIAAADIYADAVAALITRLDLGADSTSFDDLHMSVVYPDNWTDQAVDEARAALAAHPDTVPAESTTWVPESRAILAAAEHAEGAFGEGTVVVCDLGAAGLTVSVLATGSDPVRLGRPVHLDTVSGNEFDRLVLAHTLRVTGADAEVDSGLADLQRSDAILDDVNRLRADCRRAKESLSVDTDTVVGVRIGAVHTEARLVRDDIEDLLRAPVMESVALVREALAASASGVDSGTAAAGLKPAGVTAVVLGGGGAAIPLVTEMLSSTLRLPVVLDSDPASASAAGGALLAGAALSAQRSAITPAAVATTASIVPASPEDRPLREIVPAPSTPLTEPAPRLSRRKRGTLITLGAAALALVTATGLSVGTGLVGSVGEATPPPAGAATTTASSTQNPGGGRNTTVAGARPGTTAAPATDAGTRAPGAGTGTPGRAATNAPTGGAPAPGTTPGRQAPAPAPAPAPAVPSVPSAPGGPPAPSQPEPELPEPGTGGNTGGGGTAGEVLEVPGRVLDGTGRIVCGVTGVVGVDC
ncbi:Hsp70 family protein [Gordonia sp. HS-NH1]|uniref:Hsp70 family protein n=1 Tax=Gordonia sp. HS-NH1 TaxID=1435068 RepID=UPI0006E410F3|nr:Hsp70 family protein [Gordonia sp. HS-NH1]